MRYISVCSGIEAASVAWHDFGWTPVAFSEIEPFPSAVLQHHYPHVPNLGDMTKFKEWNLEPVDLLVGGTPCQSFSVAGLRKGLHDPRGGLMLTFLEIAQRYRPRWVVWENVPGVLSSNGGRDFGAFLGALGQLGYGWAFRVLDAQWFGVAQRRRRVFVVGCLGDQASAAAVLFESESVCRNPPPSREKRKDTTGSTGDGLARCVTAGEMKRQDWETCNMVAQPVAHALRGEGFDASEDGTGRGTPIVPVAFHPTQDPISSVDVCHALSGGSEQGSGGPAGDECYNMVAQPMAGSHWDSPANPHPTLNQSAKGSGGIAASDQELFSQRGSGLVAQPVAFRDPCPTLTAKMQGSSGWAPQNEDAHLVGVALPVVYERHDQDARVKEVSVAPTLHSKSDNTCDLPMVQAAMQVRRLTPTECERLQGFPDNFTNIPWRKKDEAPDGPRYKALGNSMAVPCMRWIGERINAIEEKLT